MENDKQNTCTSNYVALGALGCFPKIPQLLWSVLVNVRENFLVNVPESVPENVPVHVGYKIVRSTCRVSLIQWVYCSMLLITFFLILSKVFIIG